MTIIRWSPVNTMLRWPNIWEDEDWGMPAQAADNLDVYETADQVVVKASVAGVEEEKVEINYEKGVLTITASETEEEKDDKKYYKKSSRSYAYRVAVPGNIDLKKEPEATVKNGIVTVSFHKAEEEKPRKISIKKD